MPIHPRYSLGDPNTLAFTRNKKIQFAMRHALCFYRRKSIFTFIPKNACSSLRLSLALANGVIADESQHRFIHKNNDLFAATIRDICEHEFSFIILRSPYSRLVSVFLDKFLSRSPGCESIVGFPRHSQEFGQFTFEEFVSRLHANKQALSSNNHWIPQSRFLLFEDYTNYFRLEDIEHCKDRLAKIIGFQLVDARSLTNHGLESKTLVPIPNSHKTTINALQKLKVGGQAPTLNSFFTEGITAKVKEIYAEDILLYESRFGSIPDPCY